MNNIAIITDTNADIPEDLGACPKTGLRLAD